VDIVVVVDSVSGGELFHYLASKEKVTEDEAVMFLRQILDGLQHLHHLNIVHLDLKVCLCLCMSACMCLALCLLTIL